MQHVSSRGGPRVMLPDSDVTRWIERLGDSPRADAGLYQLACSIDEYCGVISPWGKPLLIFGDDPADIFCLERENAPLFFRWVAGDSLEQLLAFALEIEDTSDWDESVSVALSSSQMTLMDTCTYVDDPLPRISVKIRPGTYTIRSKYAESSEMITIIHSFQPAD